MEPHAHRTDWARRFTASGADLPLLRPPVDHRALDIVSRSFQKKRQPAGLGNEQLKSLLLRQLQECVALAPNTLNPSTLAQLQSAVAQYTAYSAGTHPRHPPQAKTPPHHWAEELRPLLMQLRQQAFHMAGPEAMANAWREDGPDHPGLNGCPEIRHLARQSLLYEARQHTAKRLMEIGSMPHGTREDDRAFRGAVEGAIAQYQQATHGLKQDRDFAARLDAYRQHPSTFGWSSLAMELREQANAQRDAHYGDPLRKGKVLKACSTDRKQGDILTRAMPDWQSPSAQNSAVMQTVYSLRWGKLAETLAEQLIAHGALVNNPDITGNPASLAVEQVFRASLPKAEREALRA